MRRFRAEWMFFACLLFLAAPSFSPAQDASSAPTLAKLPQARKQPVVDTYHGQKVIDDYRWLEKNSPEEKQWVAEQNAYTISYMDTLPQRDAILAYLKERRSKAHTTYYEMQMRGGRLFALREEPGNPGTKLVIFTTPADKASERPILDTAQLQRGKLFQVDWYQVSPDGRFAGMALSTGGSEDGSLYIFDTATGKQQGESVPRAQFATAGGAMAWKPDSSGFYYTRYPQAGERPQADLHFYQQVYFHRMGASSAGDAYVLGKEFPRIAEITFVPSPDDSRVLASVENGDGGEYIQYLIGPDGVPQLLTKVEDKIVAGTFGPDNSLWLLSRKTQQRGEIWHLPAGSTRLADARVVIKAGEAAIEGSGYDPGRFMVTQDRVFVTVINGGPEEIHAFDFSGRRLADVPTPPVASISSLVPDGVNGFIFAAYTYTSPGQWYRVSGTGTPLALSFQNLSNIDMSDIEVQRVFATSKDGTRVPMTVLMRKGTVLNGSNPTLLTGYGGYGISMSPSFSAHRLWFDHGGVIAVANLRGGAEYGENWHEAGKLLHKQNVFDDFAACTQFLFDRKYTSPAHLAIEGESNGGLLMGAALTQHPEMFRAVVSYVGIYDMLRFELDPNGSFNVTEYGSVKDLAQFQAIYAYSPYHHVAPGTEYPAVLFITGDNDNRVNPAHSRKMTAALQAATTSGRPILLMTNANAGHGISTNLDEALLETADMDAFLFAQLGMTW